MRKLLLTIAALLTAGVASAQPIGVKVVKDTVNGRILVKADDGTWLEVYGAGAPSFTTFLGENVPANAVYTNTTTATPYRFSSGSWTVSSGGSASSVTPATTTVGSSTNCFVYADASSLLQCGASFVADDSGSGNSVFTVRKTMSGGSGTASNFLNVTGTFPTTMTAPTNGAILNYTTAGSSSQTVRGLFVNLGAGYTGSSNTMGVAVQHLTAGTGVWSTGYPNVNGNIALFAQVNVTTAGSGFGTAGYCGGNDICVGAYGVSPVTKNSGTNIGVMGISNNAGATPIRIGGYFGFNSSIPTFVESALYATNSSVAAPIAIFSDNNAAVPTTAATATTTIADGGWLQNGNGVLTNATMTAETQARNSGSSIHSYTWTNAQVVALGAALTGDIKVATLPAKTVVKNAYVVITGQGAGVTTLTVAFGRVSAGYIDYIVASDAKAAANTVYGDASGERGTNLTGYDLPSYTATTDVYCHFISTGANLDQVTGSTGRVIIETALVP